MEFVQELLRPFVNELGDVREELGAERARRRMAEERAAALEAELDALKEAREITESEASSGPGESPTPAGEDAQEATEHPQPADPPRRSLWRRLFGG